MIKRSLIDINTSSARLGDEFYKRDVLLVAPELIGKILVFMNEVDIPERLMITEVEAYRGEEDLACHACRGKTLRNSVMYEEGGVLYVYLIYGIYWMLNIVTGLNGDPQAVLIRGLQGINGPGKLTRRLSIDKSYYGESLLTSRRIWVEDHGLKPSVHSGPRIGIDYAGEHWKSVPWRFYSFPQKHSKP